MFTHHKNGYAIKKVAGYISAPYDFNPKKLKEYCEENANEARIHAREFVKSKTTADRV